MNEEQPEVIFPGENPDVAPYMWTDPDHAAYVLERAEANRAAAEAKKAIAEEQVAGAEQAIVAAQAQVDEAQAVVAEVTEQPDQAGSGDAVQAQAGVAEQDGSAPAPEVG